MQENKQTPYIIKQREKKWNKRKYTCYKNTKTDTAAHPKPTPKQTTPTPAQQTKKQKKKNLQNTGHKPISNNTPATQHDTASRTSTPKNKENNPLSTI
jgi:hypothetical protein